MNTVYVSSPKLSPKIVTLADPVAARFDCRVLLILATSTDITCEILPIRSPVVTCTRRLPPTPRDPWQRREVSDSQEVRSHWETLSLRDDVSATPAIPAPDTETLTDPVAALFVRRTMLLTSRSKEKLCVSLPTRDKTVTTA